MSKALKQNTEPHGAYIGEIIAHYKKKLAELEADLHLRLISILDKAEKDEADRAAMMAAYQPLRQ